MGHEYAMAEDRRRAATRRRSAADDFTNTSKCSERIVQAKLQVGAVDDRHEREADQVARQVMQRLATMPTTPVSDSPADSAGRVQRSPQATTAASPGHGLDGGEADPAVARRVQRASGGGRQLDASVRERMQAGFGADFSGVRVHADAEAASLSRSLNARAFTTGSDIYFGEGQYQPDSTSGQELLAHELTHTLQQGSTRVQRSALPASQVSNDRSERIRRWDLGGGVDVSKAVSIRTIETGQAVFMLKDASGEEIVIKAEDYPLSLMKLATMVHQSVHEVDIIDSHDVDGSQKAVLTQKIGDPGVTNDPSWAKLGAGSFKGFQKDGLDAAGAARSAHQQQIAGLPLQAQAFAKGDDAKKAAKSTDKTTGLRAMLTSPKYMRQLGSAAAADMFTGNSDRVGGVANLGNWVATADQRVQLIDNMDGIAKQTFGLKGDNIFGYDMVDWGNDHKAFYATAIKRLLVGAEDAGDADISKWADADGGFTRRFMIEDYQTGFEATVERIVKLYGSDKKKSAGRAAKADVKSLSSAGYLDYWEVLKARARYMQNPSKGKKYKATVLKRQQAADKKAAKRKK